MAAVVAPSPLDALRADNAQLAADNELLAAALREAEANPPCAPGFTSAPEAPRPPVLRPAGHGALPDAPAAGAEAPATNDSDDARGAIEADVAMLRRYAVALADADAAAQRNIADQVRAEVLRMRRLACEYEATLVRLREEVEEIHARCAEGLAENVPVP